MGRPKGSKNKEARRKANEARGYDKKALREERAEFLIKKFGLKPKKKALPSLNIPEEKLIRPRTMDELIEVNIQAVKDGISDDASWTKNGVKGFYGTPEEPVKEKNTFIEFLIIVALCLWIGYVITLVALLFI
jgi:hypothetical protein